MKYFYPFIGNQIIGLANISVLIPYLVRHLNESPWRKKVSSRNIAKRRDILGTVSRNFYSWHRCHGCQFHAYTFPLFSSYAYESILKVTVLQERIRQGLHYCIRSEMPRNSRAEYRWLLGESLGKLFLCCFQGCKIISKSVFTVVFLYRSTRNGSLTVLALHFFFYVLYFRTVELPFKWHVLYAKIFLEDSV